MSDSAAPVLVAPTVVRKTFARPGARAWLRIEAAATRATVRLNGEVVGEHLGAWTPFAFELTRWLRDENELEITCEDTVHTTNGFLPVIGVRWTGAQGVEITTQEPILWKPAAPNRARVDGSKLLVDGKPFRVRGILHWGYYPELGHPWPDDDEIRREITDLKSLGFNLIKFCLWVPPHRYYELCEELGMLMWQEYPIWDRRVDQPADLAEFEDLLRNDAAYSSIILRTLTCENDAVDRSISRAWVEMAHRIIPGSVVLDNSGWLCNEVTGDFHDEHVYLHPAQMRYYGRRSAPKLTKPLLLGESIVFDTDPEGEIQVALEARRHAVEILARDLPDAGYVLTGLRDLPNHTLGLYTNDGRLKYTPEQWAWQRDDLAPPREIPELSGAVIGPRKGEWKCRENVFYSPVVRVLDEDLPADLIRREFMFELLSGRVLENCDGTRVLIELLDVHAPTPVHWPLVIEFCTQGERRIVSALRHDTPAGRELWRVLQSRRGPAPEIGPLVGTSIVLDEWQMKVPGGEWINVRCDTPLVNGGRNVIEGWATFRSGWAHPGGIWMLHCTSVGDYFELFIDGRRIGTAGPRDGTWSGTRDIPRTFDLDLSLGYHSIEFHVRDWRGAGGMVGPVYLATDLNERIF